MIGLPSGGCRRRGARDDAAPRLDVETSRDLDLSVDDSLAMDVLIASRPRRGCFRAVLSLLGGGFGSDRLDVLADRGFQAECADRFVDTECDFLKGAEGVKYLWPVNERVTIDADVYSARAGAQLTRARRASRELAAAVVKSVRDWFPLERRG